MDEGLVRIPKIANKDLLEEIQFIYEDDLKEKVSKFLFDMGMVFEVDGLEEFMQFFDQVRAKCLDSLLLIPGTTIWSTETFDGFYKF